MTNYNDEEINFLIEESALRKAMIEGKEKNDAEGREAKYAYHEFRKEWRKIREAVALQLNEVSTEDSPDATVQIDAIEATSTVKEDN